MNILEMGNYIVPGYAGMILAEQGHRVVKVTNGRDPILGLHHGDALWEWINHRKTVIEADAGDVIAHMLAGSEGTGSEGTGSEGTRGLRVRGAWEYGPFDAVIENFRPAFWEKRDIDRADIADLLGLAWVTMEADTGDTSFDVIAQARSWMEYAAWLPFYLGDTSGGLWLAFKALSMRAMGEIGHATLYHATCLQKMVEGELVVRRPPRTGENVCWDADLYTADEGGARVLYKGRAYHEPVRDEAWKRANLRHKGGRMIV